MGRPRFDVHLHPRCAADRLHFRAKTVVDRGAHGADAFGARARELTFRHVERPPHALARAVQLVLKLNRGVAELGGRREECLDLRSRLGGAEIASALSADRARARASGAAATSGTPTTQGWTPGHEYDEQGPPKHASRPHRSHPSVAFTPWALYMNGHASENISLSSERCRNLRRRMGRVLRDGTGLLLVALAMGLLFVAVRTLLDHDYLAAMLLITSGLSVMRAGVEILRPTLGE